MTTSTYADVLALIQGLAGVNAFTSDEQTQIGGFINRRIYQAYAASPVWPRYLQAGEARPCVDGVVSRSWTIPTNTISSATRAADVVTIVTNVATGIVPGMKYSAFDMSGTVDIATAGSLTCTSVSTTTVTNDTIVGTVVTENTASETYSDGGSGAIVAVTLSDVEVFFRITDGNRRKTSAVSEYDFDVDSSAAYLYGTFSGTSAAWVGYKKAWGGPYSSSSTDIPQEFFYYVAHAAYADFLRMDGQTDKAAAEEQNAQQYLIIEIDRVESQSNNNFAYSKFTTYTSRQSR